MRPEIIGWDIGGAHLKAAELNSAGTIARVWQQPCALWQGLHTLYQAFAEILKQMPAPPRLHALTMTGELVDLFTDREHGVYAIVTAATEILGAENVRIFAGHQGFIKPEQLRSDLIDAIASANWYASAAYAASKAPNALFIDIGSTTTDIVLLHNSTVQPIGMTDFQRLSSEELVYTGVVRTPVMAVADKVVFRGQRVSLMAEYFATMADVYRLTGELDETHDQSATADGASKTVAHSARRLARMIGCDYHAQELASWKDLARNIRSRQLHKIQNACERQLSRRHMPTAYFIGAGIGRFLAEELARQLDFSYRHFDALCGAANNSALTCADCAPAAAVALLAGNSEQV